MNVVAKSNLASKPKWKKTKIKIPGQSWAIKEKLDVVNAILADKRFTYAEKVAAVTMTMYFHNTASGDLHPSRQQVTERCGVTKHITISATKKMKRFGYLDYEQTSGGRNERNTYHLKKTVPQTVQNLHPLAEETVQNLHSPSAENARAAVQNLHSQIPLRSTTRREEVETSPSPRSEASVSQEKKINGLQGKLVEIHSPSPKAPLSGQFTDPKLAAVMVKYQRRRNEYEEG